MTVSAAQSPHHPRPSSVLAVVGTRPECIKVAPVIHALRRETGIPVTVVNSGQHSEAVRDSLHEFGLRAEIELPQFRPSPNMHVSQRRLRADLRSVVDRCAPQLTLVQGDTLTAYSAARAAYDARCPVAHVEAGLRTDDVREPFPEEWFRRSITRFVDVHFAPSALACENLRAEGIDDTSIHLTGNTGIDALRALLDDPAFMLRTSASRTVLVTLHRRSNHHRNALVVCDALVDLCAALPGLRILFPVHPNPGVSTIVRQRLAGHPAVDLVAPMGYREFIAAAAGAALIISDSGGIQEEAPHLGTPLLVPRCNTERPECLATGFVRLVEVDRALIVAAALTSLAASRKPRLPIDRRAPFGAGDAASHIARVVEQVRSEPAAA